MQSRVGKMEEVRGETEIPRGGDFPGRAAGDVIEITP